MFEDDEQGPWVKTPNRDLGAQTWVLGVKVQGDGSLSERLTNVAFYAALAAVAYITWKATK